MKCNQCGQLLDPDKLFCNTCETLVKEDGMFRKYYCPRDGGLLLGYIGWLVFVSMSFVMLPKILLNNISNNERINVLITIANINQVIAFVDIIFMILIVILSKSKIVKMFFVIYLVCKIFLLVFDRI